MKLKPHDALVLAGAAITIAGIACWSWKSAVLVTGLSLFSLGVSLARKGQ